MVELPAPIQKMPSSQRCSHRNSMQNVPIESSTAFTGTTLVTISMFMSWSPKFELDTNKCRCHKVVRTEILSRMHRSRAPQLLRGPLSWLFPCLCLGATFQQSWGNLWAAFGQLVDNFWATKMGDKKCVKNRDPDLYYYLGTFWESVLFFLWLILAVILNDE